MRRGARVFANALRSSACAVRSLYMESLNDRSPLGSFLPSAHGFTDSRGGSDGASSGYRSSDSSLSSSVDMGWKEMRELFYDVRTRRCTLCNEYLGSLSYSVHNNFAPHSAREGVAVELLRAFHGTPTEICDRWWNTLDGNPSFFRLRSLTTAPGQAGDVGARPSAAQLSVAHAAVFQRLWRRRLFIRSVLHFLRDHGVLRDCFRVVDVSSGAHGRTWEFDRLEWVGDNVIKPLFNDRVACLFPLQDGGVKGKLNYFTSMIDSNDGLARAYDFFDFGDLTGSDKIISKFKSDVVEAAFGELQSFLWATQVEHGTEAHTFPLGSELAHLRAVARHAMTELGHAMVMMHVEGVKATVEDLLAARGVPLVRTDSSMRGLSLAARAVLATRRNAYSMKPTATPSAKEVPQVTSTRAALNLRAFRVNQLEGLTTTPTQLVTHAHATVPKRLLGGYAPWLATSTVTKDAVPVSVAALIATCKSRLGAVQSRYRLADAADAETPSNKAHEALETAVTALLLEVWCDATASPAAARQWITSTRPPFPSALMAPALCTVPHLAIPAAPAVRTPIHTFVDASMNGDDAVEADDEIASQDTVSERLAPDRCGSLFARYLTQHFSVEQVGAIDEDEVLCAARVRLRWTLAAEATASSPSRSRLRTLAPHAAARRTEACLLESSAQPAVSMAELHPVQS
jgi:hypothetical protein